MLTVARCATTRNFERQAVREKRCAEACGEERQDDLKVKMIQWEKGNASKHLYRYGIDAPSQMIFMRVIPFTPMMNFYKASVTFVAVSSISRAFIALKERSIPTQDTIFSAPTRISNVPFRGFSALISTTAAGLRPFNNSVTYSARVLNAFQLLQASMCTTGSSPRAVASFTAGCEEPIAPPAPVPLAKGKEPCSVITLSHRQARAGV